MTSTVAAPITSISKFRALFLIMGATNGFTYKQVGTMVDQYSKGEQVFTLSWGAGALKGFSISNGKTSTLVEGKSLMMQRLQHQAFKIKHVAPTGPKPLSDLNWKWGKLSDKKILELEALAKATFQVI